MKLKRFFSVNAVITFLAMTILNSCMPKKIKVGEMEMYQDPAFGFGIAYPKEWIKDPEVGKRIRIFSSFDARDKFIDPSVDKPGGLYLEVGIDTTKTLSPDSYVQFMKDQLKETFPNVVAEERTRLMGNDAVKIPFSAKVDARNEIRGYRIASLKDRVVTYVDIVGYNQLVDDYKVVFDSSLSTVRFGQLMAAKSKEDISKPSETYEKYKGKFFDIDYPSNFEYKFPTKANTDLVMELKGYRQDCVARIEVSNAKNLTVEKVVEQNKANLQKAGHKIKNSSPMTIDGNKAQLLNLTYAKGEVDSRAYFLVKNNKLYYIFLTWYRPQASVYIPSFEKVVSSLKLK